MNAQLTIPVTRKDGETVEVPAREIDAGGQKKLVPFSSDPHLIWGKPVPKDSNPDESMESLAEKLLKTFRTEKRTGMLVNYLRKGQDGFVLAKSTFNKGEEDEFHEYSVAKGAPYGAVVAFRGPDEKVYLGWSKRCEASADIDDNGKPIPVEPLPFTKMDALRVAILRGLTNEVNLVEDNVKYGEMEGGTMIGSDVVPALHRMADRAERYFGEVPENLYFLEQKVEGEEG